MAIANKRFSVLIPAYNHGRFIAHCIDSILAQTYQDFDIWVIDDCSSDDTVEVVKSYDDPRIHLVVNDFNHGINCTVTRLVEMSKGEYVCGLASDDAIQPSYLEEAAAVFEKCPDVGVVYCDLHVIDKNGRSPRAASKAIRRNSRLTREQIVREIFLRHQVLWSPGRCVRRSVLESIMPLPPSFMQLQDVEEAVRLLLRTDRYVVKTPLVDYRVFGGNISAAGELVTMRTECEDTILMSEFLGIGSDDFLNRAFADDLKPLALAFCKCDRQYVLSRLALTSELANKRRWGYIQLLHLVAEKGMDGLYAEFGISYKDILSVSKSLYNPKKDYKRKCRRLRTRIRCLAWALFAASSLIAVLAFIAF